MTTSLAAFAPAKINLSLHVTGRRPDGYHLLDSIVAFADVGDFLTLTPADTLSLSVKGPFRTGVPTDESNIVWKAARAMAWTGHIELVKNLPHGAGIGGGSSDAAAVFRVLAEDGSDGCSDAALNLGADVPVCVYGQAARMRGIGEQVVGLDFPELHAVLVNPGVPVPTGPVFKALTPVDNAPMPDLFPAFLDAGSLAYWLKSQRNDLQAPALGIAGDIASVLADLECTGNQQLVRMSGSGATCFAIYPTLKAAKFAAYELEAAHPDWWIVATTLS